MGLPVTKLGTEWQIQAAKEIWLRCEPGHLGELLQLLDVLSFLGILGEVATGGDDILLKQVLHKLVLHIKVWIHRIIISILTWRKSNFTRLLSFLPNIRIIIIHRHQIRRIHKLI